MFEIHIYRIKKFHKNDENFKKQWNGILNDLEKKEKEIKRLIDIYEKKLKKIKDEKELIKILDEYEKLFDIIKEMNKSLYNGLIVKSDYTYYYIRKLGSIMNEVCDLMKKREALMNKFI